MTGLTRPLLRTVPDEPDQVPRLARFRDEHPGIAIRAGTGYWQAVVPEPNGETVLTRYLLARSARRARRALHGGYGRRWAAAPGLTHQPSPARRVDLDQASVDLLSFPCNAPVLGYWLGSVPLGLLLGHVRADHGDPRPPAWSAGC